MIEPAHPGENLAAENSAGGDSAGVDTVPAVWHWLFTDQAGVVTPGPGVAFGSQPAAEDWLRDQFDELADLGIAAATLLDGEHAVYGPMYLPLDGSGSVAEAEL